MQASAVPPTIISYQGRLTDSGGNLLGGAGTNYYFQFSIWDSPTVGAGNKVWPVTTPATTTVNVRQGVFSVNIGDTANGYPDALNLNFANYAGLYIQVQVSANNISSETLSPRQQLTSAVFAQVAGAVVGTTTPSLFGTTTSALNSFVTVQSTSTSMIPLSVLGSQGQTANIFQVQNSALQNLFSVSSAGAVSLASALTAANGGTGISSYTPGDITYANSATSLARVASSTGGTILQTSFTTGAPTWVSTSTILGTGVGGQVLAWSNGVPQWIASTTYANGAGISTAFANNTLTITNSGVTSLIAGSGISISGATGAVTVNSAFPFTQQTQYGVNTSATTTLLQLTNGFTASSTSHLTDFDFRNATGTGSLAIAASTTIAGVLNAVGGANFGTLTASGLAALNNGFFSTASSTLSGSFYSTLNNYLASTTLAGNSLFTSATSTTFAVTGSSTVAGQFNAVGGATFGAITVSSCAGCSAGSTFAFPPTTFGSTAANATTTTLIGFTQGIYALASSTIGNGNQFGGLTVSGGATTTGSASILGSLAVGTTSSASTATLLLYNTNTAGASPSLVIGGNPGGDTDFWMARTNNNDTTNNDALSFGQSLIPGTSPIFTLDYNSRAGVGTTSPFAKLSVHANPTDAAANTTLFAIGSSTATATTTLFTVSNTGLITGLNYSLQSGTTTNLAITASTTVAGQFNATGGATLGTATIGTLTLGNALTAGNGGTGLNSVTAAGVLLGNYAGTGYQFIATSSLGLLSSTSISASAPLSWNSSTGALTIAQSGTAANGYLSLTDFNTFNNKISSTSLSGGSGISYNSSTGVISAAFPFTQQTQYGLNTSATTTLLQLTNGFTASSTSHLVDFDFRNATGTGSLAITASTTIAGQLNAVGGATFGTVNAAATTLSSLTVTGAGSNMLLALNGSGAVSASSTPTAAAYLATSTTATSTFAGGVVLATGAGNVGIGSASPTFARLFVDNGGGAGASLKLEHTGSNFIVRPVSSGGNATIIENTGGGALAINPSGNNVGIGTSSAYAQLTVATPNLATGALSNLFLIASSTSGTATTTLFSVSNTGNAFHFGSTTVAGQFNAVGGATFGAITVSSCTGCSAGGSSFPFTPGPLGNSTSTLIIDTAGIMATASSTIGNGAQAAGLTISGGATTTGNAYFGGNVGIGTIPAVSQLANTTTNTLDGASTGSNIANGLTWAASGAGYVISAVNTSGVSNANGLFVKTTGVASTNRLLTLNANGTDSFVVQGNGNVGIKNSAPGFALDVSGAINVDQFSSYKIAGNSIFYASTTNHALVAGAAAGGQLYAIAAATDNTAIGYNALSSASLTGVNNTAIGSGALTSNLAAQDNIAIGVSALNKTTTGGFNIGIGGSAGFNNVGGINNVYVGYNAGVGVASQAASENVGLGYKALNNINSTTDTYNVAIGYQAGTSLTTGANNILIGPSINSASTNSLTTGSSNIAIGFDIALPSAGGSNQLDIGNLLYGAGTGSGISPSTGRIGIGTTTPFARLSVHANNNDTNQVLFAIGSSTSAATSTLFTIANTGLITGLNYSLQSGTTTNLAITASTTVAGQFNATGGATLGTLTAGASTLSSLLLTTALAVGQGGTGATSYSVNTPLVYTGSVFAATSSALLIAGTTASSTIQGTLVGTSTLQGFLNVLGTNSTSTFSGGLASTYLNLTGSVASSTFAGGLIVNGGGLRIATMTSASCDVKSDTSGNFFCGTDATGGGGGSFPFTPTTNFGLAANSTTTPIFFTNGLQASTTVRFGNAGASPFFFNGAVGNLGLGTTTPTSKLSVHANNGDILTSLFSIGSTTSSGVISTLFNFDNTGDLAFGSTAADFLIQNGFDDAFSFGTSTTAAPILSLSTRAGISTGGLVGIASSSPWGKLSVEMGSFHPSFVVSNQGSTSPAFLVSGALQNGLVGVGTSSPYAQFSIHAATTSSNTLFAIGSTTSSGVNTNLFAISNSGQATYNVPNLVDNAFTIATSTGNTPIFSISTKSSAVGMIGVGSSTPWGKFSIEMGPLNPAFVVANNGSSTPSLFVSGVNNNGNVGIGTSSPFATLSVQQATANLLGGISTIFAVASSSVGGANTTLFSIDNTGVFNVNPSTGQSSSTIMSLAGLQFIAASSSLQNTAVGIQAGFFLGTSTVSLTSAYQNTALGYQALMNATTTQLNTAIGAFALQGNTLTFTGNKNTAIGVEALRNTSTGGFNNAIGFEALFNNSTGSNNQGIGAQALFNNTFGVNNQGIGTQALFSNNTGQNNNAIGLSAMFANTSGSENTAIGLRALQNSITGSNNTAIGEQASNFNNAATNTVAVGYFAANGTAAYNAQGYTVLGYQAGLSMASASDYGTLVGYQSGFNITSGYANIGIGASSTANITTGFGNVMLGNNTYASTSNAVNSLNIGNLIYGTLPATSTAFRLPTTGFIGIGTSSPFAKFSIHTNNGDLNQTLFAIGSSTATATTTLFIVKNSGLVGIGSSTPFAPLSVQAVATPNVTTPLFAVASSSAAGVTTNLFLISSNGTVSIGTSTAATSTRLLVQGGNNASSSVAAFTNGTGTCYIVPTTNGVTCSSDIRLKKNINNVTPALTQIMQLRPVTYNWKTENDGSSAHTGFIAQELQGVFSDLIYTDPSGYLSVNYAGLSPYLVSAVQQQQSEIDTIASLFGIASSSLLATSTDSIFASSTPFITSLAQIIASSTATTTASSLTATGVFASASQALKDALASAIGAVGSIPQKEVKVIGDAVSASVGVFEKLFAKEVHTDQLCVGNVCVTQEQFLQIVQSANQGGSHGGGSGTSTPDTTPPVIVPNGNNPATVSVGATYVDLGAAVTDNVSTNLSLYASVDGGATSTPDTLYIDTTDAGTHTVLYSATDQAGNTGVATRTVVVQ